MVSRCIAKAAARELIALCRELKQALELRHALEQNEGAQATLREIETVSLQIASTDGGFNTRLKALSKLAKAITGEQFRNRTAPSFAAAC